MTKKWIATFYKDVLKISLREAPVSHDAISMLDSNGESYADSMEQPAIWGPWKAKGIKSTGWY